MPTWAFISPFGHWHPKLAYIYWTAMWPSFHCFACALNEREFLLCFVPPMEEGVFIKYGYAIFKKYSAMMNLFTPFLSELCCRKTTGLALDCWSRQTHIQAVLWNCQLSLVWVQAWEHSLGRRLSLTSLLSSVFPLTVMPAHPTIPPLQTAAVIDCACNSSWQQRGRDKQSVTDSLPTWQSRRVWLEWNYCLHCSVCNGTGAVRFPTDTASCSLSIWQSSQLITSISSEKK